jgi:flavorubredoxin
MALEKMTESVYYVGVMDWDRRLFDALIPLPDGTSYNSYIIKGSQKTALIDTVDPPMAGKLIENLKELGISKIDYIVSHHGEQDHSGSIPDILASFPDAKVVTNEKNKGFLIDLLHIDEDKFIVIKDKEEISLGDKTLSFIFTPWVHWPETLVTYLKEDKVLFSCDFLGSHYATDDLIRTGTEEDKKDLFKKAKRYYAEIMMPFASNIIRNLDKISSLDVDIYAPSHGPIYKGTDFMLQNYRQWASGEVKNTVLIPYVSMHGSTLEMVNHLKKALEVKGIEVKTFDLVGIDIGELAMELVDAATVVLGTSTVLTGPHPQGFLAAYLLRALRPKTRFLSVIGSFGWATKALDMIGDLLSTLKAEIIQPVIIKGLPDDDDLKSLDSLAQSIADKHKDI